MHIYAGAQSPLTVKHSDRVVYTPASAQRFARSRYIKWAPLYRGCRLVKHALSENPRHFIEHALIQPTVCTNRECVYGAAVNLKRINGMAVRRVIAPLPAEI
jgi:hypothetical protein